MPPITLSELATIIWAIAGLIAVISLRKPITGLLNRINEGEVSTSGVKIKAPPITPNEIKSEIRENIEQLEELKKHYENLLSHEERYENTEEAFLAARKYIEAYLSDNHHSETRLELKLLAIGMTFSWSFVTQQLPVIIRKYPDAKIRIKVLVADPEFLDSLDIAKDLSWASKCRENIAAVERLINDPKRHMGRLQIEIKKYRNLPHWHGLLIDENHLFMGRADWKFEGEKPEFTVGQNTYRHYGDKDERGKERILLFENWHLYYFDYASSLVNYLPEHEKPGFLPKREDLNV